MSSRRPDERRLTRSGRSARGACARRTVRGAAVRAGAPDGRRARARSATTWSGSPRIACISARKPVVIVVSALPSPSAVAASSRFCTAGKIDDGDRRLEAALDVGAHDDVHRRGGDAAGRAAVDLGEHRRCEPALGERAPVRFPRAPGEVADRGAGRGVADDDELPRLLVLRARRERRRGRGRARSCRRRPARSGTTRHARWRATTAKKSSVIVASLVPTRTNEFTYMMRRLGPRAQCLNASVSVVADALASRAVSST